MTLLLTIYLVLELLALAVMVVCVVMMAVESIRGRKDHRRLMDLLSGRPVP